MHLLPLSLFLPLILLHAVNVHAACHGVVELSCNTECYKVRTCHVPAKDKPTCPRGQYLQEVDLTAKGGVSVAKCGNDVYYYQCTYSYSCVCSLSLNGFFGY